MKVRLGVISHLPRGWFFPKIEYDIGYLDEKDKLFINVTIPAYEWHSIRGDGGKRYRRSRNVKYSLAYVFRGLVKSGINYPEKTEIRVHKRHD